jgi:hypothetical protein
VAGFDEPVGGCGFGEWEGLHKLDVQQALRVERNELVELVVRAPSGSS